MQIQPPCKIYTIRSGAPIQPPITSAPTDSTTNNEKENVKPTTSSRKSTRVKVPTKSIEMPKPVTEVDLTTTTEEEGNAKENSDSVNPGVSVTNAKKRKRKQKIDSVVTPPDAVTKPVATQVPVLDSSYKTPAEAVKSRKCKVSVVSDSVVMPPADVMKTVAAQASEVVHSRKHTQRSVVSNPVSHVVHPAAVTKCDTVDPSSETTAEVEKSRKCTKSVTVSHVATPVVPPVQVENSNMIPTIVKKSRKGKVEQKIVVSNEAVRTPLMVSGQIGDVLQLKHVKVTVVPSAVIPSSSKQIEYSESDGNSQMEAEEVAYCQQLVQKQNELSKQK